MKKVLSDFMKPNLTTDLANLRFLELGEAVTKRGTWDAGLGTGDLGRGTRGRRDVGVGDMRGRGDTRLGTWGSRDAVDAINKQHLNFALNL